MCETGVVKNLGCMYAGIITGFSHSRVAAFFTRIGVVPPYTVVELGFKDKDLV